MRAPIWILCAALFIFPAGPILGQPDEGFYYQASVRDAAGKLLKNQEIQLRITLLRDGITGDPVYMETHTVVTSPFGIVNLTVGNGEDQEGDFHEIDWGSALYFIKLEIDETGTGNFIVLGTSQILTVPIAIYAKEAGNVNYNDTSSTNEIQSLSYENDTLRLTGNPPIRLRESQWERKNDVSYMLGGTVGLGIDSDLYPGENKDVKLEIVYQGDDELTFGEKRGIRTTININGSSLKCIAQSMDGIGIDWAANSVGIGTYGGIKNLYYISTGTSSLSGIGGGVFTTQLTNLLFGNDQGSYRIAGMEAGISGSLSNHPDNAIVSGLIALDEIKGARTYAGYFDGRGYFSGNVGMGITSPQRSLHISDVMRLEPRATEPSDPQKGDIYMDDTTNKLRAYDGTQWQDCW